MRAATAPADEAAARKRAFLLAWAGIAGFMLLQVTSNALSAQRDFPHLDPRAPFLWEYSSGICVIALIPALHWLLCKAPPTRKDWPRLAVIYAAASVIYSLAHVAGFIAIRKAAYALAGARYSGVDLVYEYRKDLVGFVAFLLVLSGADWTGRLWARTRAVEQRRAVLDLRDGARLFRVRPDEIVAVASARNYLQYHLLDGRQPLIRGTLAQAERELADAGLLRIHRSWLVNPNHVRTIAPGDDGDARLELAGGLSAPLSRRFRPALARLRGSGAIERAL